MTAAASAVKASGAEIEPFFYAAQKKKAAGESRFLQTHVLLG